MSEQITPRRWRDYRVPEAAQVVAAIETGDPEGPEAVKSLLDDLSRQIELARPVAKLFPQTIPMGAIPGILLLLGDTEGAGELAARLARSTLLEEGRPVTHAALDALVKDCYLKPALVERVAALELAREEVSHASL